ncbi:ABC transporter ATP-binding protein [Anabaena subtropica]|uniref:ABC transporter ATP-binding protein n=1 Tax=Anabaena subtropica FACHB-260 TaxID=2692884 RepID=A0ABR8CR08_9NOST|nr:ABC transporter ATP-binding protein [Anabaena subtropica]MBD2345474.1 ABC transporter ATP-binding protein [Anabaena subtropica FACHB-260]
MSDTIIRVENLDKKYIIGHQQQEKYSTIRDVIANGTKGLLKSFQNQKFKSTNYQEEFWALKDISFEIKQGDRVGIIGRNGAGKSTLLKILSRITEPTKGSIKIKGRVASLLEVGTGFHPELTGRENIYLNGAILGMSKAEIKSKFDEIVAFAEVEKFLDTPVKRYSSGMYVRLAFAVAAHLEPEVLIVDEVLAVGDVQFQKKCLGKMEEVGKEGRTILFVSHNIAVVQTLCNRGIFLQRGSVEIDDSAYIAISTYLKSLEGAVTENLLERTDRRGKGLVKLSHIKITTGDDYSSTTLATGRPARFEFYLTDIRPKLSCIFTLYDQYGQPVINFNSMIHGTQDLTNPQVGKTCICELDELGIVPGRYRMNVAILSDGELQDAIDAVTIVDVEPGDLRGRPIAVGSGYGSVCIHHRWILPV